MTGGAGFAKQGQGSFRDNHSLRNKRTPMRENPYAATNNAAGTRNAKNALKVQQWMAEKSKRERRISLIIFCMIVPSLALLALLFALIS